MKVFVVGPWMAGSVMQMFRAFDWTCTEKLKEADLIQYTGGADIHPRLYKHGMHPSTYADEQRDRHELLVWEAARKLKKPVAGICRGAQFINAMCGGTMYQNVNNHFDGDHWVKDDMTGEMFKTTSVHHQMMIPSDDAVVLAYAHEATIKEMCEEDTKVRTIYYTNKAQNPGDPEIVMYWPDGIPAFGFQGHPEFTNVRSDLQKRYMNYLSDYVFDGKKGKVA